MSTNNKTAQKRAEARQAAKEKHQKETQAQADADALKRPDNEPPKINPRSDRPFTLHELNQIARRNNEATRDEDRAIAQAIAKTAYDSLQGRRTKSIARRSARARDAAVALDAAGKDADKAKE